MKRKKYIDKRLDWRDPHMPIIDGNTIKSPEQFQRERIRFFEASQTVTGSRHYPHYSNDPAYYWSKKK